MAVTEDMICFVEVKTPTLGQCYLAELAGEPSRFDGDDRAFVAAVGRNLLKGKVRGNIWRTGKVQCPGRRPAVLHQGQPFSVPFRNGLAVQVVVCPAPELMDGVVFSKNRVRAMGIPPLQRAFQSPPGRAVAAKCPRRQCAKFKKQPVPSRTV